MRRIPRAEKSTANATGYESVSAGRVYPKESIPYRRVRVIRRGKLVCGPTHVAIFARGPYFLWPGLFIVSLVVGNKNKEWN